MSKETFGQDIVDSYKPHRTCPRPPIWSNNLRCENLINSVGTEISAPKEFVSQSPMIIFPPFRIIED